METDTDPVISRVRSLIDPTVAGALDYVANTSAKCALISSGTADQFSTFCQRINDISDGEALLLLAHPSSSNVPLRLLQTAQELHRTAQLLLDAAEQLRERQERVYLAAQRELQRSTQ